MSFLGLGNCLSVGGDRSVFSCKSITEARDRQNLNSCSTKSTLISRVMVLEWSIKFSGCSVGWPFGNDKIISNKNCT